MPHAGSTARGRTPASQTRLAQGSGRGQLDATARLVTRLAPADSPASTSLVGSPPKRAAFSVAHTSAAQESSMAAGNGWVGASR